MGLLLFWVHDRSPDQVATRLAIGKTVPMVVRAIDLVEVPELKSLIDEIVDLITVVRSSVG